MTWAENTAAITKFAENLRRARPNETSSTCRWRRASALSTCCRPRSWTASARPRLVVVPHGVLHLLPWACLTVGSRRLFEWCAVGILPNLASLPLLDDDPATGSSVALIGAADYSGLTKYGVLTESPLEIADVEALYAGHVVGEPVTGRRATEVAFWALAEPPGQRLCSITAGMAARRLEPLASG
jgi:hypothetical protein